MYILVIYLLQNLISGL